MLEVIYLYSSLRLLLENLWYTAVFSMVENNLRAIKKANIVGPADNKPHITENHTKSAPNSKTGKSTTPEKSIVPLKTGEAAFKRLLNPFTLGRPKSCHAVKVHNHQTIAPKIPATTICTRRSILGKKTKSNINPIQSPNGIFHNPGVLPQNVKGEAIVPKTVMYRLKLPNLGTENFTKPIKIPLIFYKK